MDTPFLSVLCHWLVVVWVFVLISVLLFIYLWGFLGNSLFVLPAHTCSALLWSCSRTADSGRNRQQIIMVLRVGPDVYPEVKIITTTQLDMICFVFFFLKQQHIMTSQAGEQRMFLATLLTLSAALLLILQASSSTLGSQKRTLESLCFIKHWINLKLKPFPVSLYIWIMKCSRLVFFFLNCNWGIGGIAESCSWHYIEFFGFQK